eukprot:766055-Hanusia_phi.AAC.16
MSLGVSIASRPKAVFGALTSEYLITICHQIIFLATGIFTTICNQHIFYQGGAEPSTMLLSFPTYAGMFLVVLLPISRKPAYISQRKVFFSAMFDVGSNVLCMLGLQIVGSGVFQIHFDEAAERFILGITITLIGCVGYAGSYVINEFILSKGSASIVPQQLCLMVGTYGCLAHLLYFGCYTIPHWDSLVSYKVREKGGHMETILFLYFLLVVSAFLHNMSFFHLICHTGAVSTGILTALRAIGVFIVSGVWFCEHNPAQCLTTNKSIAACVVGFGAILYSIGKLSSNPSDGAMDAGLNEKGSAALETLDLRRREAEIRGRLSSPECSWECNARPRGCEPGSDRAHMRQQACLSWSTCGSANSWDNRSLLKLGTCFLSRAATGGHDMCYLRVLEPPDMERGSAKEPDPRHRLGGEGVAAEEEKKSHAMAKSGVFQPPAMLVSLLTHLRVLLSHLHTVAASAAPCENPQMPSNGPWVLMACKTSSTEASSPQPQVSDNVARALQGMRGRETFEDRGAVLHPLLPPAPPVGLDLPCESWARRAARLCVQSGGDGATRGCRRKTDIQQTCTRESSSLSPRSPSLELLCPCPSVSPSSLTRIGASR